MFPTAHVSTLTTRIIVLPVGIPVGIVILPVSTCGPLKIAAEAYTSSPGSVKSPF